MTRRCLLFLLVVVCLAVGCWGNDAGTRPERAAFVAEAIGNDAGGLLRTSTTLTSSLDPSPFGQTVTFTAKVVGLVGLPLGVVTFSDGAGELGSAALNANGRATFSTAALNAGAHAVVARFPGDLIYRPSSSAALAQQVNLASTRTTLSSSSTPAIAGMPVTFNAIVRAEPPGASAPSGTVTFDDGNVALGTSVIGPGGVATLTTTALTVGAHALSASYSGDAGFAGSVSADLSQTVNRDGVIVMLGSSTNPSVFGATVTFFATVASAAPGSTPTGNVTFRNGFTVLATGTLNAAGTAAFETATLPGGAHTISVTYEGDTNRGAPGVASVTQTVIPAPVSVVVTASDNPSVFGQALTLTAQVTAAVAAGDFDGVVTFLDGAAAIGAATVDASGTATVTTRSLSVGTHSIGALYGGDSDHAGATSPALTETVGAVDTTTSIAASSNPGHVGAVVTFAATVTAVAPGTGVPNGTVTFRDGAGVLGEATLDPSGVATLTVPTLDAGNHPVTASYGGAGDFGPSTSTTLAEHIAANSTMIVVISTPNPSAYGARVTVVATVNGSVTTATGNVTFRAGADMLGEAVLDATGAAAFTTASLSAGAHTLSAEYAGDAANSPGSGTVTHVVNAPPTTAPADAGRPGAGVEPPRHDAGGVSVARTPNIESPPQDAASLGGAANCGCRVASPRDDELPRLLALTIGVALLVGRRRRTTGEN